MTDMNFDDWVDYGMDAGWCGPPVCATHDGVPTTESEDEDDEPCLHVIRLYADETQKDDVEANHSPSRWRAGVRPQRG